MITNKKEYVVQFTGAGLTPLPVQINLIHGNRLIDTPVFFKHGCINKEQAEVICQSLNKLLGNEYQELAEKKKPKATKATAKK